MCRPLVSNLFLIVSLICLFSCRALNFYGDADKPFFNSGKKEIANTDPSDSLNVLTFNIKKARKIQLAISEMKQLEKKRPLIYICYRKWMKKAQKLLQWNWA